MFSVSDVMKYFFIFTFMVFYGQDCVYAERLNRYSSMFNNLGRVGDLKTMDEIVQSIIDITKYNDIWKKFDYNHLDNLQQSRVPMGNAASFSTEPPHYSTVNATEETTSDIPYQGRSTEAVTNPSTEEQTTSAPLVVSELCRNQTAGFIRGLNTGNQWALQMFDAAGKPSSNILGGAITWVGDYDECLSVQGSYNISQTNYTFDTQFCVLTVYHMSSKQMINVGVCLPDGCSNVDISNLINPVLWMISPESWIVINVNCQEPDRPFDTRATIVLVIVSIFAVIMVIATLYDVLVLQIPRWQKEESVESVHEEDEKSHLINKISEEYRPGLAGKVLLSFSIYTNGSKILSTQQGAGSLTAINGIRFITMTWVILGHTCIFAIQLSLVDNVAQWLPERLNRVTFGPIYNAFPAVDTFFALSGLLLTYLVMKELKKNDGKINWPMFYFHRFWRLTPPYMLILMVYVSLFPYIGQGPGWPKDGAEVNYCEHSWFRNLLYVNNLFVDGYDMCMGWSWYLANDMQFFIISPLIILPLFYHHVIGVAVLFVFLLAGLISCGVLSAHYDLPASIFDGGKADKFFNEYVKPWNRIGPYLIGMYAGYILYKTKCKFRINRFVNWTAWIFFAVLACTVLYGLHNDVSGNRLSTDVAALYTTTHRIVWAICICWVIFACATGNGGFINTFLSWKAFVPLSRLTYCAYLVHPIVIYYYLFRRHKLIHFSDTEVAYEFLGHLVLSYAVAFVASLTFESPMMGLEKALLKRSERKR